MEQQPGKSLPAFTRITPVLPRYSAWYRIYRDGYFTHYTKDGMAGKGRPLVTMCVLTDMATSRQYVGYSICSPRDRPDRRLGRYIARARAEKACGLGVQFHIYREGLGRTPRAVLAACGLTDCVVRVGLGKDGDCLCIPLKFQDSDAGQV